jgi:putative transposase
LRCCGSTRRDQWKAKYGGLDVSEGRRLKVLADENAKLKKQLAEAMLDNAMLISIQKMVTPVARRQEVAHLCSSFEVSQRRAGAAARPRQTRESYFD